jgi:hypothetical protein
VLHKAMQDIAERKREDANSAMHVAMFKPPGERSPADLKILISQVLNHVPAVRDLQSNTRLQIAASVRALVRSPCQHSAKSIGSYMRARVIYWPSLCRPPSCRLEDLDHSGPKPCASRPEPSKQHKPADSCICASAGAFSLPAASKFNRQLHVREHLGA